MVAADPRIIVNQLQTAVLAGNHTANDLLLIDGGGNDAADVIGLYLSIATGGATAVNQYATALKTVLPAADVDSRLSTAQGLADLGGLYMKALATRFYDQIKANALDKGAKYVAVLNVPSVVLTPRFQAVLAGISAANGGGTAGTTAAATASALFDSWVSAFNTELAAKVGVNANLLLVDVNTSFKRPSRAASGLWFEQRQGRVLPRRWHGHRRLADLQLPHLHGNGFEPTDAAYGRHGRLVMVDKLFVL